MVEGKLLTLYGLAYDAIDISVAICIVHAEYPPYTLQQSVRSLATMELENKFELYKPICLIVCRFVSPATLRHAR